MGSTFWGSTALFFLDPIDNIAVGVNKLFGKKLIKSGSMTVTQQPMNTDVIARSDWHDYWGTLLNYSKHYYSNSFSDPDVDTESKVMIAYRFGNGEG